MQYHESLAGEPKIDRILDAFVPGSHRRLQASAQGESTSRQQIQGYQLQAHQLSVSSRSPVLELTGASACSGKTQLLYHIVSLIVLPTAYNNISLQGLDSAVVLCDLDHRFSLLRLREIMSNRLSSSFEHFSKQVAIDITAKIVQDSLCHLHIFRPQTSLSLLATLQTLSSYLLNTTSHFSANRRLGAMILSNLNAFVWQDRLDGAEEKECELNDLSTDLLSSRFRDIVSYLKRIQEAFSCPVIGTSCAMFPSKASSARPLAYSTFNTYLPNVWNSFVTVRLILQRESVRKFPPGISAEEAMREARQRREAVQNSAFSAMLDWTKSQDWREETRNILKHREYDGGFFFKVTAAGVDLDLQN